MKSEYAQIGSSQIRLIEECSELIKALCKADRFGLHNWHPASLTTTNRQAILNEMSDVERCIAEVRDLIT